MVVSERDIMGGLAKGLAVVETFTSERPRQSISQASAASGLDRATTRRCLLTLAHEGYAHYDGKFFTLTPRVLRLGTGCLASMPLPKLVPPILDELSDELGESTSVSILDGGEIVYIARATQRKVMSIALMPGSRLPAYCTSMGRVLLAALPDAQAREIVGEALLPARTRFTLTDPAEVFAKLRQARAQGYAINDQEIEIGLRSLAVPLFDVYGRTIAALNVGVAATQVEASELVEGFLPSLKSAQQHLRRLIR